MHPAVVIGGLALAAWAWSQREQKGAGDVAPSTIDPWERGEPPADAWPLDADQAGAVIDSPHEWKLPEEARGFAVWVVPDKSWPAELADFVWIQHPESQYWFVVQSALAELLKGSPEAEF